MMRAVSGGENIERLCVSWGSLDPMRKGLEEVEEKKETVVGVNRARPSNPIRALTDQRLWARAGLGTT
jgi:hypothetical protein